MVLACVLSLLTTLFAVDPGGIATFLYAAIVGMVGASLLLGLLFRIRPRVLLMGALFAGVGSLSAASQEYKRSTPDFNYPQTVIANAQKQWEVATRNGDARLLIDALIRYTIAQSNLSPDLAPDIIARIETVAQKEKRADVQAILYLLEAQVYRSYGQSYTGRWRNDDRALPADSFPADLTEWGSRQFDAKVSALVSRSLLWPEILRQKKVADYPDIIRSDDYGRALCPTLYDFLMLQGASLLPEEALPTHYDAWAQTHLRDTLPYLFIRNEQIARCPIYTPTLTGSFTTSSYTADSLVALYQHFSDHEAGGLLLADLPADSVYYHLLNDYVSRFPRSRFEPQVSNLIRQIEEKSVQIYYPRYLTSADSCTVQIRYIRNVNSLKLHLYRIPDGWDAEKNNSIAVDLLDLISTQEVHVTGTVPFEEDTLSVRFAPQEVGRYLVVPGFEVNGKLRIAKTANYYRLLNVTNISLFTVSTQELSHRVFAVDARTGKPLTGIEIYSGKNHTLLGTTGADGSLTIGKADASQSVTAQSGADRYTKEVRFGTLPEVYHHTSIKIFTDLALYRPGEQIRLTALCYDTDSLSRHLKPKQSLSISLLDAGGNTVTTDTLITDEHGQICTTLSLPTDRMNGRWYLSVSDGARCTQWHYIHVSEYKTPNFYVELTDLPQSFAQGHAAVISGRVSTYSGMGLADQKVTLTLNRGTWSFWWRRLPDLDDDVTLDSRTLTTDASGRFTITYDTLLFATGETADAFYHYTLLAVCTDQAGETQTAEGSFVIGRRRRLELADDMVFINDRSITLPLRYADTEDATAGVACRYTLTTPQDSSRVIASGRFRSERPVIDLTATASGAYRLRVEIEGDSTAQKACSNLILYKETDRQAPTDDALWIPACGRKTDAQGNAVITIGCGRAESFIYYVASSTGKVLCEGWLRYAPGLHTFKYAIPQGLGESLTLNFICTRYGRTTSEKVTLTAPSNRDSLTIQVQSFRDRLTPGTQEHWSLQLLGKNQTPCAGIMMLKMTDKAIDDIAPSRWAWSLDVPDYRPVTLRSTDLSSLLNYMREQWMAPMLNVTLPELPELYLYDRNLFVGSRNRRMYKSQAHALGTKGIDDDVIFECAEDVAPEANALMTEVADTETITDQLTDISLREGETKVALWRPQILSDAEGRLSIDFEVPDANTTWILQAIAFTERLTGDRLERQVVSSKPLMVEPSLPRFLRGGDRVTLSASIHNRRGEKCMANALIELFNPRTGEVLANRAWKCSIDSMRSDVVSIPWTVSDTLPFIGFRVKAADATFGDGEQALLPILPAISPIIESRPFYLDAGDAATDLPLPSTPSQARFTLEYCDNPTWYCITALPTLTDDEARTSSALAHSLFATVLAEGLSQITPEIRQAIDYWTAHNATDSTLTSALSRHADLKMKTLTASPWLSDAERQTLRMTQLATLFDSTSNASRQAQLIDQLQDLQNEDGGFAWYNYPGRTSSLHTTQEVLRLIGRLHYMGYLDKETKLNDMMRRAIGYYDKKIADEYDALKKQKHPQYSRFADYVYTRTFYPEYARPKKCALLTRKALTAMSKDWRDLNLTDKAFFAIALQRNGNAKTARKIMESVRQFGITHPTRGMYWEHLTTDHYRWTNRVALTAYLLEALHEIDPHLDEQDQIRKWLLLEKQTTDWGTSSLAADAIYALLTTGRPWLQRAVTPSISWCDPDSTASRTAIKIDEMERYSGYFCQTIEADSNSPKSLCIERGQKDSPAWGALYAQYSAPMTDIRAAAIEELSIHKTLYRYDQTGRLQAVDTLHVGDKIQVRCVIKNSKTLEYVTLDDERAACMEPADRLSGYALQDQTYCYREIKDAQTRFFFNHLDKGTHIISYDLYVTSAGTYSSGVAAIQCQYAPQMTAHSAGGVIEVR